LFFITGISTFTWVLVAYVALHFLGPDGYKVLTQLTLDTNVLTHGFGAGNFLHIKVKEVFLIVGALALFIEISKAATANSFGAGETLLSFVVAIVFIVMFFMIPWAQNPTFLLLGLMSLIDATGGFIIELNAARRDINIA